MTDPSDGQETAIEVVASLAVEVARLEMGVLGGTATDTGTVASLVRRLGSIGHGSERIDAESARVLSRLISDLDRMILKVERDLNGLRRDESAQAATAAAQFAYAKNAVR